MTLSDIVQAVVLGVVEGLTEFIPVSSTGHMLLVGHFLGYDKNASSGTFDVLVQFGAILALLAVYAGRLWNIVVALPSDPRARRFVIGVLIAFLPAAVIGGLAHDFIKNYLFNVQLVCYMLIAGGLVLLAIDDLPLRQRFHDSMDYPLLVDLRIGFFQCLAMVPGVSRSGATIVGAMLMGADKRSAAEFSFFLAMPTMLGAFAYDLLKSYKTLSLNDGGMIAIGFVAAFISGYFVVRTLLDFVSRRGFALFAWWRIVVGIVGLAGLWIFG